MSNERDELAQILFDGRGNTIGETVNDILLAGYRKPRTITTIGDLAGLPEGTVIYTAHERIFEYAGPYWAAPGFMNDYDPTIDWLPATVLYEPEA